MSAFGPFLRKVENGFLYWCEGCGHAHRVQVGASSGPNWSFNGDQLIPTFNPSVRVFTPAMARHVDSDGTEWEATPEQTDCHHFVKEGRIEYCGDSAHALAGQSVPMTPFPGDYHYGGEA